MAEPEVDRWRRYRSVPGGLPARRWLARTPVDRVLREVQPADVETSRWPAAPRANVVLDLAEAASCACGGNRATIEECEPDRSSIPIVVAPVGLDLGKNVPVPAVPPARPAPRVDATDPVDRASAVPPETPDRSRRPASRARVARPSRPTTSSRPAARRNRAALLTTIPAVVLMAVGALGMAAYALTSLERPGTSSATGESSAASGGAVATPSVQPDAAAEEGRVAPSPEPRAANADSARRGTQGADPSAARADTSRPVVQRRPRRPRAPEVVPGWLPQGTKAWTPGDTNRAAKPDSVRRPGVRPDSAPPA
jgi:hypothetical protein